MPLHYYSEVILTNVSLQIPLKFSSSVPLSLQDEISSLHINLTTT